MTQTTPMTKRAQEKPKLWGLRMYKRHLRMVRERARRDQTSRAEVIRKAIESYCV